MSLNHAISFSLFTWPGNKDSHAFRTFSVKPFENLMKTKDGLSRKYEKQRLGINFGRICGSMANSWGP